MLISSRGRYCLQVMIDLAEHADQGYIPLKEIAKRQGLSLRYLEKILPALAKNNIIIGHPGKCGGYRLSRAADEYTLGEILRLAEGSLAPTTCVESGAESCAQASACSTLPVWTELDRRINGYLDSVTLADLLQQ
ncbi:MAG: Rrf2 family transcriptional regulator [Oscillospiraceae bacterium]|nr:Rrf2 family transcriptional regulator [Oscillospiraceae bacterium]MBQ8237945.1 Rrf2 family transcriptional regulator [Oscillospiraceae bacterium]